MNRRAFTLLEVVIALGLMAMLSLGIGAFVRDMRVQQRSMQRLASQIEGSSILLELIERSVATCVADGGPGGAGVSGTPSTLRILSRAVVLQESGRMSDLAALDFRFLEPLRAVTLERAAVGYPGSAAADTIAAHLKEVRFRYHDAEGWQPSFDSLARGRLPLAIEVAIWFDDGTASTQPVVETDEGLGAPPEEGEQIRRRAPDRLRIISVHDARPEAEP